MTRCFFFSAFFLKSAVFLASSATLLIMGGSLVMQYHPQVFGAMDRMVLGDWFAATKWDLEPDLITFAKGVTCGYAPLGGVIASPRVAEPFFNQAGNVFRHGYTYSGHAIACVAGIKVMDILERENLIGRAAELEEELYQALLPLEDLPIVSTVRRGVGALCAVQLDYGDDDTLPGRAAIACRKAGVLTRAMAGGSLQVSPPLIITKEQVDEMAGLFREGLSSL